MKWHSNSNGWPHYVWRSFYSTLLCCGNDFLIACSIVGLVYHCNFAYCVQFAAGIIVICTHSNITYYIHWWTIHRMCNWLIVIILCGLCTPASDHQRTPELFCLLWWWNGSHEMLLFFPANKNQLVWDLQPSSASNDTSAHVLQEIVCMCFVACTL